MGTCIEWHLNPTLSFYTLKQIILINFTLNHNIGGSMKGTIIPLFLSFLILAGCSSLTLKPGDFAWPVESVLKVDDKGIGAGRTVQLFAQC